MLSLYPFYFDYIFFCRLLWRLPIFIFLSPLSLRSLVDLKIPLLFFLLHFNYLILLRIEFSNVLYAKCCIASSSGAPFPTGWLNFGLSSVTSLITVSITGVGSGASSNTLFENFAIFFR